jgi:hypothetical protein
MPKITDEPLDTIQLRLFKSDHDTLRRMFAGHVGVNKAIRTIVRTYLRQAEAKANAAIDAEETASLAANDKGATGAELSSATL